MMLITGGSGRLGGCLREVFPEALAPARGELDLLRREAAEAFVARHRPSVVVHAAAYTSVQKAEVERERCWAVNVSGTQWLVEAVRAANRECYFVYISTACVFHGDRGGYSENDVPHPKNFYGLTKLLGEFVAGRMPRHLIVRTNFVSRAPWPYARAFVDRFGTYLYADEVATAVQELMAAGMTGLVHVAGDRKLSMLEVAASTTAAIQPMRMTDVALPLTVDMSLTSVRIPAYRMTPAPASVVV
jgi:dTDP-4-dehydrorhamnose reductase